MWSDVYLIAIRPSVASDVYLIAIRPSVASDVYLIATRQASLWFAARKSAL
jgi:hypothetical protein